MQRSILPWVLACVVLVLAALVLVRVVETEPDSAVSECSAIDSLETNSAALADVVREASQRTASVPVVPSKDPRPVRVSDLVHVVEHPRPPPPGRIEVVVLRDEDGLPIQGATVKLWVRDESLAAESLTNVDGRAEFLALETFAWTVTAEFEGRVPGRGGAILTQSRPNAVVELRLVRRRVVTARIVGPGGAPFALSSVGLERADQAILGLVLGASCQPIGANFDARDAPSYRSRARDPKVAPFTWMLEFPDRPTGCVHAVLGDFVLGNASFDPWSDEVNVAIDARAVEAAKARLVLRVVEELVDVPIENARVVVRQQHGKDREARTDASGRAEFADLVAGTLLVTVEAKGRGPKTQKVERPIPGEVVVTLGAGRVIDGVLLDQYGEGRAGRSVAIYDADGAGGAPWVSVIAARTTDSAGRFRFEDLPPGRYAVASHERARSRQLLATNLWGEDVKLAECELFDALGLVLKAYDLQADPKYQEARRKFAESEKR